MTGPQAGDMPAGRDPTPPPELANTNGHGRATDRATAERARAAAVEQLADHLLDELDRRGGRFLGLRR